MPKKGQEYTTSNGRTAVYDGEDWVLKPQTGVEELKHGAVPWLAQNLAGLTSVGGSMGDLAMAGAEKAGKALGTGYTAQKGGNLPTPRAGENLTNAARFMREQNRPSTPEAKMERAKEKFPNADLGFQPETRLGQYGQGAINAATALPLALATGGESLLPSMLKTGASAIGGVEGGNLGEKAPDWMQPYAKTGGQIMGSILGYGTPGALTKSVTPPPPSAARRAQTALVRTEAGKGAVDPAQATKSGRVRAALGPPSEDQPAAITQAMLKHGGIDWDPATGSKGFDRAVKGELQAYSNRHGMLERQTQLTPSPQLQQNLSARLNAYAGRQPSDTAVVQNEYNRLYGPGNQYGPRLSGMEYNQLRDEWRSAGHPVLRDMSEDLDRELARQNPAVAAQWAELRRQRANLEGLNHASERAVARGDDTMRPSDVYSGMDERAQSPLKDLAAAATATQKPIEPNNAPGVMATALSHAVGAPLGYFLGGLVGSHGMIPGLHGEAAVLAPTLAAGGAVPAASAALYYGGRKAATKAAAPFIENPGNLRNMSPEMAAKLLMVEQPGKAVQEQSE